MCQGKVVRFYCPEALAGHPLCPSYNPYVFPLEPYMAIWVQTAFVCCGDHPGACVDCPEIYAPGNIEIQDATLVVCDECSQRHWAQREAGIMEQGGNYEDFDVGEIYADGADSDSIPSTLAFSDGEREQAVAVEQEDDAAEEGSEGEDVAVDEDVVMEDPFVEHVCPGCQECFWS